VSASVSPFWTEEVETSNGISFIPSRCSAIWNEHFVRVEFSKNRFATVMPDKSIARAPCFKSIARSISAMISVVSSISSVKKSAIVFVFIIFFIIFHSFFGRKKAHLPCEGALKQTDV